MPRNARADAEMPAALTCADVRAREWDFMEGALPISERPAVQTHLDACESCRHAMALCRSASQALLSAPRQIPPVGDLRAGFYARLAAEQRTPRRYGRPLALSALAVGILAVALIRPLLFSRVASPPSAATRPSDLAFAPTHPGASSVPGAASTLTPRTDVADSAFPDAPGLSAKQIDRLLRDVDTQVHGPRRRVARRRPMLHLHIRRVQTAGNGVPTLAAANTPNRQFGFDALAKSDFQNTPVLHGSLTNAPTTPLMRARTDSSRFAGRAQRDLKTGDTREMAANRMEAVATLAVQPMAGVDLAVDDRVRNFSQNTHIANGFEEQGDTITAHIEAGGN